MPSIKSITVVIERPDGSTFTQEIEHTRETVKESIEYYRTTMLGHQYFIVHWWVNYNE